MRLRNIPGAREAMAESPFVINEPALQKGRWNTVFGNKHPIHIEIGMGKGLFLTTLAKQNPDNNYIGIEKFSSVLVRALEKRKAEDLPNLLFLRMDALDLTEVFAPGEVSKIYLNFSDPWPKERHAKRRLTSTQFFLRYDQILTAAGVVEFKTDNTDLFDFSLESVKESGWKILAETRDLHQDEVMVQGNVMTEYEERFSSMGNPICKLIASR